MRRRLIYLGGNGHCAARLAPARQALARLTAAGAVAPFDLFDVPYPGFEGRPRAPDLDTFLACLSQGIAGAAGISDRVRVRPGAPARPTGRTWPVSVAPPGATLAQPGSPVQRGGP